MSEERGPSWYDISLMAESIADRWGAFVELRLLRPIRRIDGRGYTSWTASVVVSGGRDKREWSKGFSRPWGARGGSTTAPAAFYVAMLDAQDWLEERQAAAERQASF